MLCDQIANATLDEVRGRLNYINDPEAVDWVWRGFDRLRPKIKAAHKFMLDDPVALAAESVRLSRPTAIRDALDFCALLFPTTWIEWSRGIVADRRSYRPAPCGRSGSACFARAASRRSFAAASSTCSGACPSPASKSASSIVAPSSISTGRCCPKCARNTTP